MRSLISQLSLHKLEVFCAVVEAGSLSLAAERLGVAQPVVSVHLKALSQKMGTPLMRRQGRHLRLTEAGARVHLWAQEVMGRTLELEREMAESREGSRGTALIGASMTIGSYVLPEAVVGFHDEHPGGEISLRIATPQLVVDALQAGVCDFGYSILDTRQDTSGLEVEKLYDERLVLVTGAASAFPQRITQRAELSALPFVSAQRNTPRRVLEDLLLERHAVTRGTVVLEFGHAEATKRAVMAGAGCAFLFLASVNDELSRGTLREVLVSDLQMAAPVYQLWRRGKRLTGFHQALIRHLRGALGARN